MNANAEPGVTVSACYGLKPAAHCLASLRWMLTLLEATEARAAWFGCYGLHEWAMVYRSEDLRHSKWPLRLSTIEIAAFVESQAVCCTHYDALPFLYPAGPSVL